MRTFHRHLHRRTPIQCVVPTFLALQVVLGNQCAGGASVCQKFRDTNYACCSGGPWSSLDSHMHGLFIYSHHLCEPDRWGTGLILRLHLSHEPRTLFIPSSITSSESPRALPTSSVDPTLNSHLNILKIMNDNIYTLFSY